MLLTTDSLRNLILSSRFVSAIMRLGGSSTAFSAEPVLLIIGLNAGLDAGPDAGLNVLLGVPLSKNEDAFCCDNCSVWASSRLTLFAKRCAAMVESPELVPRTVPGAENLLSSLGIPQYWVP